MLEHAIFYLEAHSSNRYSFPLCSSSLFSSSLFFLLMNYFLWRSAAIFYRIRSLLHVYIYYIRVLIFFFFFYFFRYFHLLLLLCIVIVSYFFFRFPAHIIATLPSPSSLSSASSWSSSFPRVPSFFLHLFCSIPLVSSYWQTVNIDIVYIRITKKNRFLIKIWNWNLNCLFCNCLSISREDTHNWKERKKEKTNKIIRYKNEITWTKEQKKNKNEYSTTLQKWMLEIEWISPETQ